MAPLNSDEIIPLPPSDRKPDDSEIRFDGRLTRTGLLYEGQNIALELRKDMTNVAPIVAAMVLDWRDRSNAVLLDELRCRIQAAA